MTPALSSAAQKLSIAWSRPLGVARSVMGRPLPASRPRSLSHLRMADEFHRFLTEFSVRPGRILEISHQRLPKLRWAS